MRALTTSIMSRRLVKSSMKFCGMRPAIWLYYTINNMREEYAGRCGTETKKAAEAAFLCNQKIVCRLAGHLTGSVGVSPVPL
jgi:hypothetical protein